MTRHLLLVLLATASVVWCAEQPATTIATWSLGSGTVAGAPAQPGTAVALGQTVTSPSAQPARLALVAPLEGLLTLSPGAALSVVEIAVDQGKDLVIDLTEGAVQVDLDARGPYASVRVRGVALDVRITGTMLVVQRIKRDADYVALVQGRLKAGLRQEIAAALGKGETFDLESRQGIGASTTGGLEAIASLSNRPQIASLKTSIKDQATAPQQGDGGWDTDLALDLLNDLLDQLGLEDVLLSELTDALGEALFEDLQSGPADQAVDRVYSSSPSFGVLAAPPPPPPF
jgi:hypothetical protein